ncbi:anthrax toxin-like adenylyl cyclase domain-containing protein [Vibrio aquimaris]|uniref:Calmodulin-sensitive adenylate cyclase n=1 Tax=Vibrio aquimaris TaxID=2587862 RepID=A0A5P9CM04_9VIBR|nr:anthrax toxin-like adenylyl cyclase domain-containing protein [Vibrio aquimaris]QFT26602.1 Calmodulin-sensitive adenylate cyclase precursor [Vibrio aquimaris]
MNKESSLTLPPKKPEKDPFKSLLKAQGFSELREDKPLTSNQLIDNIAEKSGIVKTHLLPLQQVAHETQQIISFRPVDRMSTGLIEEGYPTKGFAIKGKSSNHGPQAGFICVDQNFSKLHTTLQNDKPKFQQQVEKYNASVQSCLNQGDAVAVNLSLSQARLGWLVSNKTIAVEKVQGKDDILKITSAGLEYKAEKKGDKFEISHNGKPLKVLADPKTNQPLTADYDLMFIAPKAEHLDLAKEDNLPVKRVHYSDVSETYKKRFREKEREEFTPGHFFAKEDETKGSSGQAIGNATPRIAKMIDKLNLATVGKNGNPVVHHNADSGSPATDTASNYPITVFMPEGMVGYETVHIIENADQLAVFVKHAKTHGFSVPTNPKWERKVSQARSLSFEEASRNLSTFLQARKTSTN